MKKVKRGDLIDSINNYAQALAVLNFWDRTQDVADIFKTWEKMNIPDYLCRTWIAHEDLEETAIAVNKKIGTLYA